MKTVFIPKGKTTMFTAATLLVAMAVWGENKSLADGYTPSVPEEITLAVRLQSPYGPNGIASYVSDRVKCALKKMGQKYKIVALPWKRAQKLTEIGEIQAFFAGSRNPKRGAYSVFSSTINTGRANFYALKSFPLKAKDLKQSQAKIGTFFGSHHVRWAEKNGYKIHMAPKDQQALFELLNIGRIDLALASIANFYGIIALRKEDANKYKWYPARATDQVVFFSKIFVADNPQFVENFNKEVPACYKSHPEVYEYKK